MKYIRCSDIARQVSSSPTHAVRAMRVFGLKPIKRSCLDGRGCSRLQFTVTEEEAQRFIDYRKGESIKEPIKEPLFRLEEEQEQKRKNEGWTVIPTYKAGTPDLILLRRNESGHLEIKLEEIKSPSDGIRKDQYAFAEKMKEIGIETIFTWF